MQGSYEVRVFDTIGSYFVDIYYSHIYTAAQKLIDRSLDVTYKKLVIEYAAKIKSDRQCYDNVLLGLNKYFNHIFDIPGGRVSDLMKTIVECSIPIDFVEAVDNSARERIMNHVLLDLIIKLGNFCSSDEILSQILANRGDTAKTIIELLQDKAIKVLCDCRDELYSAFSNKGSTKGTATYRTDYLKSKEECEALRDQLSKSQKEVKHLKRELERELVKYEEREDQYRELIRLMKEGAVGTSTHKSSSHSHSRPDNSPTQNIQAPPQQLPLQQIVSGSQQASSSAPAQSSSKPAPLNVGANFFV
jgi:hypothetical protein